MMNNHTGSTIQDKNLRHRLASSFVQCFWKEESQFFLEGGIAILPGRHQYCTKV
jgi:hypothetical protein